MSTPSTFEEREAKISSLGFVPGEGMIVWILWMTYGSFYFCRQNISAAVPGLETDLQLSKQEIGWILGSLKIAYAFGQLINGQMAERISPRYLLAIGMLGSAALNVIFGLSTGFYFLLFVWACNGYCQALGWTPCMRVTVNWVPVFRRGRVIGILGTSYQLCAALTFVISGWAAHWLGWQGAFYVPAALLALSALHMLFLLEEHPKQTTELNGSPVAASTSRGSWRENVHATLTNPALWFIAVALGLLDACRYGFTDWGLTHLKEVQGTHVGLAALKYALLPAGGIAGALLGGWATDRFFQGRRAPAITLFLIVLGGLALVYDAVARISVPLTILLLFVIGFCIFGAQVLLVGTAPADLARRGTAAAAAGFVNFMGYMGAFSGDAVTGTIIDEFGWKAAIGFWAGCAFAGAIAAGCLWNVKPRHD